MAPLSNYISFLLLTTLLLPLQTTARDSQFFSKVTHFNKETKIPNKEESSVTNKPEEQPPFIPQNENSYGLYGHESDHLPSTAATTTTTTNSNFEDTNNYQNDNNNKYYNNDAYNTKYYNKDTFGNNQNELSDTKYNEEGYNSMMEKQNSNNNNQNYHFNNNAANERSFYNNNNNYNGGNNMYNGEKQGMSDTRFLEGGKYYYDVEYEKYNPTMYSDSSREMNNNNWYNNRGNSYNNNYGNNNEYYQNNHGNYNGYKNQHEFENEEDAFKP
ncbi:hypothetical protein TSUD_385970 [Trifolium subterraneum]|uniref:Protein E6 n=1 Tax=Trifolium subterraneum TaxID=3900 RepID=A0A2Z6LZ35_TRISU|nr:hypothetical protein TSUD_385970 [Trifolium subterraneum]